MTTNQRQIIEAIDKLRSLLEQANPLTTSILIMAAIDEDNESCIRRHNITTTLGTSEGFQFCIDKLPQHVKAEFSKSLLAPTLNQHVTF